MTEYEYSFKVSDINPYIEYCKNNSYSLISKCNEERTLYRKDDIMARITVKEENNKIKKILDFKEDKLDDEILKERKESMQLEFFEDDVIDSILSILKFKKDITLKRNRVVYLKNNVKFEIDSYTYPEEMYVVAIEGNKKEVDKVYNEIYIEKNI